VAVLSVIVTHLDDLISGTGTPTELQLLLAMAMVNNGGAVNGVGLKREEDLQAWACYVGIGLDETKKLYILN
jgi:hypothetical protein